MYQALLNRFQCDRAPKHVEWLTDNGNCYTADETIKYGHALGLLSVFTSVRSLETNGMSESFDIADARTIHELLGIWFEDYNSTHLRSALEMLSPNEFIALHITQDA